LLSLFAVYRADIADIIGSLIQESLSSVRSPKTRTCIIELKNQYAPAIRRINIRGAKPAKGAKTKVNSSPKSITLYQILSIYNLALFLY
jgi:hypothetical protein